MLIKMSCFSIRYLLSKGFARLNKWFVLPVNDHSDVKVYVENLYLNAQYLLIFTFRPNYSFNFNFFLHGDNKVCASVDVQRHKHIFNLTSKDLERTSPSNGTPLHFILFFCKLLILYYIVILAPYGITGMLIGLINREIDMNALRDNWEKNYPVRHLDGLPDFVEITTGMSISVRVKANFNFVLLKVMLECSIQLVMYIKLVQMMNRQQQMRIPQQIKNPIYQQ